MITKYDSTGRMLGAGWSSFVDNGYRKICKACGDRFSPDYRLVGKPRYIDFDLCNGKFKDTDKKVKPCKEYRGSHFDRMYKNPIFS